MVLSNHLWPWGRVPVLFHLFQMNWLAMDWFFALSGFLIGGILLDSREKPTYFRLFYLRRSLRIFPIYYAVLLLLTARLLILHHGSDYHSFRLWGSPLWFFTYLANFAIAIKHNWPPDRAFHPMWSLQVEEQFYLALPFAIRYLSKNALSKLLWAMVIVSPVVRVVCYFISPSNEFLQYVLFPCRMDSLALGALIALRFRKGPWNLPRKPLTILTAGSLAVAFTVVILGEYTWWAPLNRTLGLWLSSWAAALLVLWIICFRDSRFTRFLRFRPLLYMGSISYGVYLLHMPVATLLETAAAHFGWAGYGNSFQGMIISLTAAIASASVSWFFFEKPILSLKDKLTARILAPRAENLVQKRAA